MISYKEKLNHVNTFIFDMDGVLTNGTAFIYKGDVLRNFYSKDGYAIQYAKKMGYQLFVISGGYSEDLDKKLENLGMTEVVLNASNKVEVFQRLAEQYGLKVEHCLYMGDDIPDIPLLKLAGVSACPHDGAPELRMMVDYVSPHTGGKGCVRDVIEQTLKVRGDWMSEQAYEW